MIWGKKHKSPELHLWFAWHPVRLEDGRWAWWEYVWAEPYEACEFDIVPHAVLAWRYRAVGEA